MIYAKLFNRKTAPQSMPIPGSAQAKNHAGGYAYVLDDWGVLDRFLILGSESGTYYANAPKHTTANTQVLSNLISQDGERVVRRIAEISVAGRAPKNDPAIFALAFCASMGDERTRSAALLALPSVCRTGTHLFAFAAACDGMRGWGRGLRRAIGDWYNAKPVAELELQLVKYRQREGWSHRDLLRLAHPKPASEEHRALFKWAVNGTEPEGAARVVAMRQIKSETPTVAAHVIRQARLPREAVPTELLCRPEIWEALLDDMPMTAMIRNLATMTGLGLLTKRSDATRRVVERLGNRDWLRKARVHPVTILLALRTYQSGRAVKGSGTWKPVPEVSNALESAFYEAFASAPKTGRRFLLGLDVSGSMSCEILGKAITSAEASAAMAMVTLASEEAVTTMAFADHFKRLDLGKARRLEDALRMTSRLNFGATDCSLPMTWATQKRAEVDVFVVYTDSETWYGGVHPSNALRHYREVMGIDAKLIVVGMTATKFSIADPKDPGMLDIVGFDASVPEVMAQFVS